MRLRAPRVYQKFGAEERIVAGRFELRGQKKDEVGFELGDYDRSQTLIIDPVLAYSTYLGGTGAESCSFHYVAFPSRRAVQRLPWMRPPTPM